METSSVCDHIFSQGLTFLDDIHKNWWGDYAKLEVHHGYIQWIFPIREHGMNGMSYPLQRHEIEKIKASPEAMARLMKSYDMQLHFYGCVVADKATGQLARGDNYKSQYHNLNTCSHNFLRITRILKCLGEFGYEHYKAPFLRHFIQEIWVNKLLPNCANSCANFWVGTVKDDDLRHQIQAEITKFTGTEYSVESSSEEEIVHRRPARKRPDSDSDEKEYTVYRPRGDGGDRDD